MSLLRRSESRSVPLVVDPQAKPKVGGLPKTPPPGFGIPEKREKIGPPFWKRWRRCS